MTPDERLAEATRRAAQARKEGRISSVVMELFRLNAEAQRNA